MKFLAVLLVVLTAFFSYLLGALTELYKKPEKAALMAKSGYTEVELYQMDVCFKDVLKGIHELQASVDSAAQLALTIRNCSQILLRELEPQKPEPDTIKTLFNYERKNSFQF